MAVIVAATLEMGPRISAVQRSTTHLRVETAQAVTGSHLPQGGFTELVNGKLTKTPSRINQRVASSRTYQMSWSQFFLIYSSGDQSNQMPTAHWYR